MSFFVCPGALQAQDGQGQEDGREGNPHPLDRADLLGSPWPFNFCALPQIHGSSLPGCDSWVIFLRAAGLCLSCSTKRAELCVLAAARAIMENSRWFITQRLLGPFPNLGRNSGLSACSTQICGGFPECRIEHKAHQGVLWEDKWVGRQRLFFLS